MYYLLITNQNVSSTKSFMDKYVISSKEAFFWNFKNWFYEDDFLILKMYWLYKGQQIKSNSSAPCFISFSDSSLPFFLTS